MSRAHGGRSWGAYTHKPGRRAAYMVHEYSELGQSMKKLQAKMTWVQASADTTNLVETTWHTIKFTMLNLNFPSPLD